MEKKILFLAVMEAIPTIVCDTLYTLGLHDQIPSWKIMDNKGRITVVLHWEPEDVAALRSSSLPAIAGPSRQSSTCSTIASGGPRLLGIHARSISQVRFWDEFKVEKFQLPCLDSISSSSPSMKIQIVSGKITENLGFKSQLRKVKIFCSFFFSFSNSSHKTRNLWF